MGYSPWGYEVSSMTEHTCTHTHTHHFLRKGCIKSILSMQLDVFIIWIFTKNEVLPRTIWMN